jgi:hypothetical protein
VVGDSELELVAWVGLPDGSEWIRDVVRGSPEHVAHEIGERMLAAGAGDLLRRAALTAGPAR